MQARAIMVLGALLACGLVLLWGCSGTFAWGPNGNTFTVGVDPSKVDPSVWIHGQTWIENHWADAH